MWIQTMVLKMVAFVVAVAAIWVIGMCFCIMCTLLEAGRLS